MSNYSRPYKEDDEKEKINKELDQNLFNLSNINLNNSKEYYHKNKNFIPIKDNIGFNQNNSYYSKNNINSINNNNITNHQNNFYMKNNTINNNQYTSNFIPPQNQINDDLIQNNNKRIINQNCYQINIENMNIHNSINNISQNYNINSNNEKEIGNKI